MYYPDARRIHMEAVTSVGASSQDPASLLLYQWLPWTQRDLDTFKAELALRRFTVAFTKIEFEA